MTGDFNGDGKSDILWLEPYGGAYVAQVMLSTGSGFVRGWNSYGWANPLWIGVGYFNNDNYADLVLAYPNVLMVMTSNGNGFVNSWNTYGWRQATMAAVGDFNSDGLSDLLWLQPYGGSGAYVAQINASNGVNGWYNVWNSFGWGKPNWMGVGDFNGDGKSDVALVYSNVLMIDTTNNTGNGFVNAWNTYGWGLPTKAAVGFFNNDATSDLLWLQPYGGSGTYVAQINVSNGVNGWRNAWNSFGWGDPTWLSGQ